VGKGDKRVVNMVEIQCTQEYKWEKKISIETISRMGDGG
jgi:hypothetical protein